MWTLQSYKNLSKNVLLSDLAAFSYIFYLKKDSTILKGLYIIKNLSPLKFEKRWHSF